MDEVSFILLLLLATIMALFIKFLYQLYKDRGQLSVMVSAVQCSEERDKMSPHVTRFLTLRRTGNRGSLSCLNTSTTVLMTVR